MIFLFLTFFIFTTSSSLYCSQQQDKKREELSIMLRDTAVLAWKQFGMSPKNCSETMESINKRVEKIWEDKYKRPLGENNIGIYYAMIADFINNYSKEFLMNKGSSLINEEQLLERLEMSLDEILRRACGPSANFSTAPASSSSCSNRDVSRTTKYMIRNNFELECKKLKKAYPKINLDKIMLRISDEMQNFWFSNFSELTEEQLIEKVEIYSKQAMPLLFEEMETLIKFTWVKDYQRSVGDKMSEDQFNAIATKVFNSYGPDKLILRCCKEGEDISIVYREEMNPFFVLGISASVSSRLEALEKQKIATLANQKKQKQLIDQKKELEQFVKNEEGISTALRNDQDKEHKKIILNAQSRAEIISFERDVLKERGALEVEFSDNLQRAVEAQRLAEVTRRAAQEKKKLQEAQNQLNEEAHRKKMLAQKLIVDQAESLRLSGDVVLGPFSNDNPVGAFAQSTNNIASDLTSMTPVPFPASVPASTLASASSSAHVQLYLSNPDMLLPNEDLSEVAGPSIGWVDVLQASKGSSCLASHNPYGLSAKIKLEGETKYQWNGYARK